MNYIVAGRLLGLSGLNVGCLRPNHIARVFLASDVLSFVVQGFGGSLYTNESTINLGKIVIIVGLFIQTLTLFLFLYVVFTVHSNSKYGLKGTRDGKLLFIGLYITTSLLFVRSIYRIIEYAGGRDTYVATHEW